VAVGAFPVTVTLASAIAQTTATVVATPTVVADRAGVNVGASVTADAAHGVLANDIDPIAQHPEFALQRQTGKSPRITKSN
jgi:hypothetical protein